MNTYTNFRIWKETRRKLRIAASLNDESGIEMLERLVSAELERVQKKEKLKMKTTHVVGSRYGIGVIEYDADIEKIVDALADAGVEVDEDSSLTNVFVSPENVARAVEIINGLGYSTDEDASAE